MGVIGEGIGGCCCHEAQHGEKAGFVIREEVIAAIVVRASSDAAEALEGGAGMR
jgi:hypothetical protein